MLPQVKQAAKVLKLEKRNLGFGRATNYLPAAVGSLLPHFFVLNGGLLYNTGLWHSNKKLRLRKMANVAAKNSGELLCIL